MLLGLRDPETHSDLHLMTKCFMCYPPFSALSGGTKKTFLDFYFCFITDLCDRMVPCTSFMNDFLPTLLDVSH